MQCRNIKKKVSALIDDELHRPVRQDVEAHLKSCDACRQVFENLSRTWEVLNQVPAPEKTHYLYTRIRTRFDTEKQIRFVDSWQRFAIPLASVAVIALGVFLGSAIQLNGKETTTVTAQEYFRPLDLDMFQDFPKASLSAVYFADASLGDQP